MQSLHREKFEHILYSIHSMCIYVPVASEAGALVATPEQRSFCRRWVRSISRSQGLRIAVDLHVLAHIPVHLTNMVARYNQDSLYSRLAFATWSSDVRFWHEYVSEITRYEGFDANLPVPI